MFTAVHAHCFARKVSSFVRIERNWSSCIWLDSIPWGARVLRQILWKMTHRHTPPQTVAQTIKRLPAMRETGVRFLGRKDPLEKEMATHASTLPWKIPWTEEPDRLQSIGSQRVRHDWATSLSLFTFMHWRRQWQPTAVFLPRESQGWESLVGCRLWGCTESDTTEAT